MIIQTTRFGKIEVSENQIITMPNGLLGFSNARLYTLLDDEVGSPFRWFQSLEDETLAFVTIDPQIAISDYTIALSKDHLNKLEAGNVQDLNVLVIVTMTKDIKDVTINLQGPLVINQDKKIGMQLVIPDGKYSTRHPLFGDKLKYIVEERQTSQHNVKKVAVG